MQPKPNPRIGQGGQEGHHDHARITCDHGMEGGERKVSSNHAAQVVCQTSSTTRAATDSDEGMPTLDNKCEPLHNANAKMYAHFGEVQKDGSSQEHRHTGQGRLSVGMWQALVGVAQAMYVSYGRTCLDSGATVDLLGRDHCESASNIQDLDSPELLGTAGPNPVRIDQTGDCMVEPGIEVRGAWMAPWLDYTLLSLTKRLSEGYSLWASGTEAILTAPDKQPHRFIVKDGLLMSAGDEPYDYTNDQVAYKAADRDIVNKQSMLIASALAMAIFILKCTLQCAQPIGAAMTAMPSELGLEGGLIDMITTTLPMLITAHQLASKEGETKVINKSCSRPRKKSVTSQMHAKCGHLPHDPNCDICRMARMRAPSAFTRAPEDTVEDSDKGYVIGLDYFGPFEPDVDGNVYGIY